MLNKVSKCYVACNLIQSLPTISLNTFAGESVDAQRALIKNTN